MESISYSAVRYKLKETMNKVCDDREPVIITRRDGDAVVMLSLEEYNALDETAHLTRSPKNRKRLETALSEFNQGKYEEIKLIKS